MNIIFDFGGVLGLPQDRERLAGIISRCNLPPGTFKELYEADRLDLDRGSVTSAAYWTSILAAGSVGPTPELLAELEHEDALSWTRVNTPLVAWAGELAAGGHTVSILSNMPRETLAFIRTPGRFPWLATFAPAIFSCEVGLVKPETAIFQLCMDTLGAEPGSCLFIDDLEANIAAAQGVGMEGVVYTTVDALARAARKDWGLPISRLLDREV